MKSDEGGEVRGETSKTRVSGDHKKDEEPISASSLMKLKLK